MAVPISPGGFAHPPQAVIGGLPSPAPMPTGTHSFAFPVNLSGNWSLLNDAPAAPLAESHAAFATAPALGGEILVAGEVPGSNAPAVATWLFRDRVWNDVGASFNSSPATRWGSALVWDPAGDSLVLFGGQAGTTLYNDTWTLNATDVADGAGWASVNTPAAPSARAFAAAFYDPTITSVVVYGGGCWNCTSNGTSPRAHNDTWGFANGTWTNLSASSTTGPGALEAASAGWDPDLNGGVVTGGVRNGSGGPAVAGTWLYNGRWIALGTNGTPDDVADGQMAWYAPGHEMVLFAGEQAGANGSSPDFNNTWAFTGYNWSDLTLSSGSNLSIGPRNGSALTYDPFDRLVLLFGGDDYGILNHDLWSFPTTPLRAAIATNGVAAANDSPERLLSDLTGGQPPFSYQWDFGDSSPNGSGVNARHVYRSVGSFTVTLRVGDGAGRWANASAAVTVVAGLSVTATSSRLAGDAPFNVTFNSSTSGGVGPYGYLWEFGDGFSWNSPNVTHLFMIEGTFHANFTVNDSLGDNVSLHFAAVIGGRLLATILPSTYRTLTPGYVNFTGVLQGGTSPFTFEWTFLPGATEVGQDASFEFLGNGSYNVTLVVTDALGYVARAAVTIEVYTPLSATCAAGVPAGVVPFVDTFTADAVGGAPALYYSWEFGDGTPRVPGRTTSHQYYAPGHYTVEVTVTDQLGELVNASTTVLMVNPLTVQASSNLSRGPGPLAIQLNATTSGGLGPLSFLWSFGDWAVGTTANATHAYPAGHYNATVDVSDSLGENVSGRVSLFVYVPLALQLTADPSSLVIGNVTTLALTFTGGVTPIEYSWSGLPPGCNSRNTATIDCLSTDAGVFEVRATAVDSVGENVTATVTLHVTPQNGTVCCVPNGPPSTLTSLDLAGIAAGLLAIVVAVAAILRHRRRPPRSTDEPNSRQEADTAT